MRISSFLLSVFVTALSWQALLLPESASAQSGVRGMTVGRLITPADINVLKSWKVKFVRFPLEYRLQGDKANQAQYDAWLQSALANLDTLLPLFDAAGIKVILNLYTPPGGFQSSRSCSSSHRIFCEAWAQNDFISSWQSIATRYLGNTTIYAFDLANEPGFRKSATGLMNWNQLANATVVQIRAIDSTRTIIVEPPFGDVARMKTLFPLVQDNIIYGPHFYTPLNFTQQGLAGKKANVSYPTSKLNKKALTKALKEVRDFQRRYNVPIYLGEFSAIRWAPGKSSYNYLKDVLSLFESYKWGWTYHAFREADAWSVEFDTNKGSKKPSSKETDRAKLLKTYFRKS